ncbi:unnamed protein product, partial [Discosporangium mesarthrocarpum]
MSPTVANLTAATLLGCCLQSSGFVWNPSLTVRGQVPHPRTEATTTRLLERARPCHSPRVRQRKAGVALRVSQDPDAIFGEGDEDREIEPLASLAYDEEEEVRAVLGVESGESRDGEDEDEEE